MGALVPEIVVGFFGEKTFNSLTKRVADWLAQLLEKASNDKILERGKKHTRTKGSISSEGL